MKNHQFSPKCSRDIYRPHFPQTYIFLTSHLVTPDCPRPWDWTFSWRIFFRLQIQLPQINPTLQNWNFSERTLTLLRLCCFREGYRLVWQFGIDHVLKAKLKASVNIDLLFCVSQNKLPIWIVLSNHSSSLIRKLITVSWEFDTIESPLIEITYPFPPSLNLKVIYVHECPM